MIVNKIRELMRKKNVSVYKLENDCGFAKGTVSYWMKHDDVKPSWDSLEKVAKYFKVKVADLIEDSDND